MRTVAASVAVALSLCLSLQAQAQSHDAHGSHTTVAQSTPAAPAAQASPAKPTAPTQAEVRRIDLANAKVTLKHGEIPNLDMPPMTMVFVVKDPNQLKGLKVGDRVQFTAEQVNGAYTITHLEPVR